jgi:hypothetical protein
MVASPWLCPPIASKVRSIWWTKLGSCLWTTLRWPKRRGPACPPATVPGGGDGGTAPQVNDFSTPVVGSTSGAYLAPLGKVALELGPDRFEAGCDPAVDGGRRMRHVIGTSLNRSCMCAPLGRILASLGWGGKRTGHESSRGLFRRSLRGLGTWLRARLGICDGTNYTKGRLGGATVGAWWPSWTEQRICRIGG